MPKYLFTVSFGQEDLEAIATNGGTPVEQAIRAAVNARRGALLGFFFALGAADAVALADLPDDESAASIAIGASRHAGTSAEIVVLLTPQQVDHAKGISDV